MKIIAMDMDGTLLNSHQNISTYTKDILLSLQKQGHAIVLASGRDLQSLVRFGDNLEISHYPQSGYICLNGLKIYDYRGNLLHVEDALTFAQASQLCDIAKEYYFDMILFFQDTLYIMEYGNTGIINHHFMSSKKDIIQDIHEIPKSLFHDLRKVAFIQKADYIENIIMTLQEQMKGIFQLSRVEEDWIEVNPSGIHKGHALEVYAKIKGIDMQDVIAFGNGENDIEMLKMAGKGIAMGNAFDSVKIMADDICGDYDHDGIGQYLNERKEEL